MAWARCALTTACFCARASFPKRLYSSAHPHQSHLTEAQAETPGLTEEALPDPLPERCIAHWDRRGGWGGRRGAVSGCQRGALDGRGAEAGSELLARLEHGPRVFACGVKVVRGDERKDERAEVVVC